MALARIVRLLSVGGNTVPDTYLYNNPGPVSSPSNPLVLLERFPKRCIVPLKYWRTSSMENKLEGLHSSFDSLLPDDNRNRQWAGREP